MRKVEGCIAISPAAPTPSFMVQPEMGFLAILQGCFISCNAACWRGQGRLGWGSQTGPFLMAGKALKVYGVLEVVC